MAVVRERNADGFKVIVCCSFSHRADASEIEALKQRVMACEDVLNSLEVSGAFDFVIEARIADLAAYSLKRKAYADPLARLVDRFEASFVCREFVRDEGHAPPCFWVPTSGGLRRIESPAIDKVTSEGDYCRLHSAGNSYLMHGTMTAILEKLDPNEFLHIHRSTIVRCAFVDRLIHQPHRWFALLQDGSQHRISKSHVGEVLRCLKGDSSKLVDDSSKLRQFNEPAYRIEEQEMQRG